ncbi:MAG: MFS transporter [Rhodobacteraceae bacterium]|nr:MFS transporter [Paracoccaceae bacterium]
MAASAARKRIWGWMSFDIASQPFYTLLLTFVFGPYFAAVATAAFMAEGLSETVADSRAQSLWSLGQTVTGLIIAFSAPLLGAFADTTGRRMPWIVVFSGLYVCGTWALWWTVPDGSTLWLALIAFGIGMIGAEFTTIFTNAILPSLGDDEDVGRISGTGMAVGYAGGVTALAIMLLLFSENETGRTLIGLEPALGLDPEAREGTRFVGPFTALWFVAFMVPFFLWVKEPPAPAQTGGMGRALADLKRSLGSILKRPSLAAYLGSSMLYRDALNALYAFGGVYATLVLNWSIIQIGIFGIIGAVTSAICTWLGGKVDAKIGPKPVIKACILVLTAVCVVIVGMSRESLLGIPLAPGSALPDIIFYVLGATIGATGGVIQSASRSMMVRHAHPDRPTEAFGFYALSGKATAFLAPAMIGLVTYVSESPRIGVSPLIFLFLLGLVLLLWVKPDGDRAEQWSDTSSP